MSEGEAPPVTGHVVIDAALAQLADLDNDPVAAHPARLVEAHQKLRAVLQTSPATPQTSPATPAAGS